jgi:hypothetical protein
MTEPGSPPTSSEIVFYQGEDGRSRIQVRLDGGTVWLTQRLLAELFQKDVRTINEHIQNIFEEGELDPGATIRKFRIVQTEGRRAVSRRPLPSWHPVPPLAMELLREYVVKGIRPRRRAAQGRTHVVQ